jgi:4-amino-4-deoxy-L-arabinose transferase-like glycosyltransferase
VLETLSTNSVTTNSVATKKVTKRRVFQLSRSITSRWSLPAIICLQALISLLALHNTAFQDESLYLYAGRQIVHSWLGGPAPIDPYARYFSGYPYFYPVIAGVLDQLGGVEAARAFSLLCMMGVTSCAYVITAKMVSRDCAIWAAILFAFQGPVLFMSRLATYDALCLLLLASAATLAVYIGFTPGFTRALWGTIGVGLLAFLAIAAKYAGLLFVPSIFALLLLVTWKQQGWRAALVRLVLAGVVLLLAALSIFLPMNKDILIGLSATTTNRMITVSNPPLVLLTHIVELSGVAFLLALLGLTLIAPKRRGFGALLFATALLAPAYHLYKGELVSLDKHLAFGMFFMAPLMGYAVTTLARYQHRFFSNSHWLVGMAAFLIVFSPGLQQSQNLYNEWFSSSNMISLLETQVRPASGHYLAEDYDVSRYYLQNLTSPWQWNSLDYFQYVDKSKQTLSGEDAYSAAFHDGYFDAVELSYGYNAALAQYINTQLQHDHNYELVSKVPYHDAYGTGYIYVWRKLI